MIIFTQIVEQPLEGAIIMKGEYKVFHVEGGYQIFWCPSAPVHYADKIPYDGHVYPKKQSVYRRLKQLNEKLEQSSQENKPEEAVA
jgi:hypothetical protein